MKQKLYIIDSSVSFASEYHRVSSVTDVLHALIKKHSVRSFFLVRGGASYISCGAQCILDEVSKRSGIAYDEFYDFTRNPKREDVLRGVKILNAYNPDMIIAIGGGSIIDMAKLIRHASMYQDMPLVAIPTTAGTGAESTSFSVCYEDGIKMSVDSENMLPNYVVLCPELTKNNNPYLSACTGFDALAQAIEAYWNINATEESDRLAIAAIERIYIRLSDLQGNMDWRTELMIGANLAGRAINYTRTTAPHALSYTLTSKYGYPHGHAVALTFPYFFARNTQCAVDTYVGNDYDIYMQKMRKLLDIMQLHLEDDIYDKMRTYVCQLGLGYDYKRPFEPMVVEQGINLQRANNNPSLLNSQIIHDAVASIRCLYE